MRIDAHQHFTREYLPSLLLPILKRNRFDGTVVVSNSPEDDSWLLNLADDHEFIRGVVCAGTELEAYARHAKFRGVTRQAAHGLDELAERGLTLDIPPDFELAARLAEGFPALRIAIDHVGRASRTKGAAGDLSALARYPNLFLKISGLITDAPTQWKAAEFAPWARAALAAFGPERVMYGSDWPAYLPTGTWKEALAAFTQAIGAQTLETREQLLGGTARRFYAI